MKVTATFSAGMSKLLNGAALGDEFDITARARIVGADEALIDITGYDAADTEVVSGELEVKLLLSHPRRAAA